jgi:hypothetical protein
MRLSRWSLASMSRAEKATFRDNRPLSSLQRCAACAVIWRVRLDALNKIPLRRLSFFDPDRLRKCPQPPIARLAGHDGGAQDRAWWIL